MDLLEELRSIVAALDQAGVAYLLVGGVAVSMYTTPRATEDIDLMLARDDVGRAIEALRALGFKTAGRPMSVVDGRLEIQRLTKIQGPDLLPLDWLIPMDPAVVALLDDRSMIDVGGHQTSVVGLRGLRTLKRLRSFCLALPHLPTPLERQRLRRFDELVASRVSATHDDIEALVAGWRRWWREGQVDAILDMAARLPADLVDGERRLATYAVAAQLRREGAG